MFLYFHYLMCLTLFFILNKRGNINFAGRHQHSFEFREKIRWTRPKKEEEGWGHSSPAHYLYLQWSVSAFSCEMLFEDFKRNFIFKIIQPLKYFISHLYLPGMFQPWDNWEWMLWWLIFRRLSQPDWPVDSQRWMIALRWKKKAP